MKKLWLTYAWEDNEDKDIDFIIKELDSLDVEVKFDRRNLIPGQILWEQIGSNITDPNKCDAWGIVLTKNSIKSKKCMEELYYALDRALDEREGDFPILGLLHGILPGDLPLALKIRLCIVLENSNWAEQVVAAINKTGPGFTPPENLSDFILQEYKTKNGKCLEIKPRFDRISPFRIAVEYKEKEFGNVIKGSFGPSGIIPNSHVALNWIDSESTLTDGTRCWVWGADNEINSTNSMFLFYKKRPKRIWFGQPKKLTMHEF